MVSRTGRGENGERGHLGGHDYCINYEHTFSTSWKDNVPFADQFYMKRSQGETIVTAQARPDTGDDVCDITGE